MMSRHMIPHAKPFMSANEVAIVLCMSKATIHRSLKRGDFPLRHYLINGTIRFLRRDVEALLSGTNAGWAEADSSGGRRSWP